MAESDEDGEDIFAGEEDDDDASEIASMFEEHSADDAEHGEAEGGLELDDQQSDEIRNIFLTTLPQYLEPVEEMIAQLFASETPDPGLSNTLLKSLESIRAAAQRIDLHDVADPLEALCDRAAQLAEGGTQPLPELRGGLERGVAALRAMSEEAGGPAAATGEQEPSQTLFAALKDAEGVDDSVLERLTRAGLVSVEQLRIASPDEIMAVSGLDASTVAHLLSVLGLAPAEANGAAAPEPEKAERSPEPEQPEAATEPEPEPEPPPSPRTPREELERRLREQVETEAAVDELRARLQRRRSRIEALREELRVEQRRRAALDRELAEAKERVLGALAELGRARGRQAELRRRSESLERRREEQQQRLEALRNARARAVEHRGRVAQDMASLTRKVREMLERFGPRRSR